jgi:hypothetical protein
MHLHLPSQDSKLVITTPFKHATDGENADFFTKVELSYDADYLKIDFVCENNGFTSENSMKEHNAPLYNQEVFEVFIGLGKEDTTEYLEIEINPNNALWIGRIVNPDLGESPQSILEQISPEEAGILHNITTNHNVWSGLLHIPWSFIGQDLEGNYRINFYRIRSKVSHPSPNWECDAETCDFVCWQSTLSGDSPAFHRPKRFGYLKVS